MRQLLFVDVLIVLIGLVGADPAPAPAPPKTLDQLLSDLTTQRKAKEDAAKAEADTVAAIKALLASESAKAAAAGITIEPPQPPDTMLATLQAAYTADPSVGKSSDKTAIVAILRELAGQVGGADIATGKNLFDLIHGSITNSISTRLGTVRAAIGTELAKYVPKTEMSALTQQQRDDAKKQLNRFADLLEKVK